MGCCDKKFPLDDVYMPLNLRLIEYGKEAYGKTLMEKFKHTYVWIFTFYRDEELCDDCQSKFSAMNQWFNKYGFFEDPINNVKWVVDDDVDNNLILKDLNITKTPVHLFCDKNGKIFDVIYDFPTPEWLEKYILPLIRHSNI